MRKPSEFPEPKGEPIRDLFKVKVEVEVCVLAKNSKEALKTAKENCVSEISEFGIATAIMINDEEEIPQSWKEVFPYTPYGALDEQRNCAQMIASIISNRPKTPKTLKQQNKKIKQQNALDDIQEVKQEVKQEVSSLEEDQWKKMHPLPHLKFKF